MADDDKKILEEEDLPEPDPPVEFDTEAVKSKIKEKVMTSRRRPGKEKLSGVSLKDWNAFFPQDPILKKIIKILVVVKDNFDHVGEAHHEMIFYMILF